MHIDFIPLASYTPFYYQALLIMFLIVFIDLQRGRFNGYAIGGIIVILITLYMGLRPISGRYFGDMGTYARYYRNYEAGSPIYATRDLLFHSFMKGSSYIMSAQSFFLMCAFIYVMPLYLASKKWFKQYWFYAFLMLVGSFSFWAYGTNGIRNGLGTSMFILAISRNSWGLRILFALIAIGFHKTLMLPVFAYGVTLLTNAPKNYLMFWLATIPLSLAFPGLWKGLFATLLEDDRAVYLTESEAVDYVFEQTGFRWDFLVYSASGAFAGWYYIFKMNFKDKFYHRLYNIYLLTNGFWILVITALYSNRFAYLSWFLLAFIIAYPWLKGYFTEMHARKFSYIFIGYYIFTYFMNFVYYG